MKVYAHYVEPERYPDFLKRTCTVVTHTALDDNIQFSSSRFFTIDKETNRLVHIDEDIKTYTEDYKIGKCFWLHWKTISADNVEELIDKLQKKGMYLYGFWGYVPGVKANVETQPWGEFEISDKLNDYIETHLGSHFLGYEMGEQDGRYIGAYSSREDNVSRAKNRKSQSKAFEDFFTKIAENFHGKMTILASLSLLHYFAKSGYSTLLGCESAQALINTQMWYAFVRGASKQYGILCSGNVSVWNKWGYKTYESRGQFAGNQQENWGPEFGTSLSLLRRLLYSEYMYNCELLGFEQGWFSDDNTENRLTNTDSSSNNLANFGKLSPIGKIQQSANEFVEKNGKPGAMYTPFAVIMDAFAGWLPPRFLYTTALYQSWGNIAYNSGDYQIHALFEMLYPGYENSGYFHDESGFLTATPYGEITDVLLSDVDINVLNRYGISLLANDTELNYELYDKIKRFVNGGGHMIVFAETLMKSFAEISKYDPDFLGFFGLSKLTEGEVISGEAIYGGKHTTIRSLNVMNALPADDAEVIAQTANGDALIIAATSGKGEISVITANNGLEVHDGELLLLNEVDENIVMPYDFAQFIKDYLADCFDACTLVKPNNPKLQYIVNVKDESNLTAMVINNTRVRQNFDLIGCANVIESVNPIDADDGVKNMIGYYPYGTSINAEVSEGEGVYSITPGDFSIFEIKIVDKNELSGELNPCERNVKTGVRMFEGCPSVKDFIQENPTFKQYFDTVLVGAAHLENTDMAAAEKEAKYLKRQGIHIAVDFTSLFNHFPDISFLPSYPERAEESYHRVNEIIEKLKKYDCDAVIISMIRSAEGNSSIEELKNSIVSASEYIVQALRDRKIRVIFQNRPVVFRADAMFEIAEQVRHIHLAVDTSALLSEGTPFANVSRQHKINTLVLSAPCRDVLGQFYNSASAISGSGFEESVKKIVSKCEFNHSSTIFFGANYNSWNEIYADYRLIFGEE